ncbi:MAG: two-component system sensor histidine kinase NtrB [Alphaproteobacteria bacterium]
MIPQPAPDGILGALTVAVLVVAGNDRITFANSAAEQFFQSSASTLVKSTLSELVTADNPLLSLIAKARKQDSVIREFGFRLSTPRLGTRSVTVDCAPLSGSPGHFVLTFQENALAGRFGGSMSHRDSARSLRAMAAMMAHEVKNPLSGVRGAAQLLEQTVPFEDKQLTRLIIEESDRVCKLVDEMDAFTENPRFERDAVNIHEVLDRAVDIARRGFGRGIKIHQEYDPSLPPVFGNRDHLVQVFLNLVKNACEACSAPDGEIHIVTGFRHGIRLAIPAAKSRLDLPIMVTVGDNGPGIPEDLEPHIFDPFVSTKMEGTGLGLALVAKLVDDHGGIIDLESSSEGSAFRILLPMQTVDEQADANAG